MIVRTILAVVLAAALVGASVPAIESASRERTATVVEDDVDRFVERATSLVETDDATARPGARRIVSVNVPEPSRTTAGLESLAIEPSVTDAADNADAVPGNASAITWTVSGAEQNRRVLERLALETPDGDPIVLREPGQHRLTLSLRGSNARPRVHVSRYARRGGTRA